MTVGESNPTVVTFKNATSVITVFLYSKAFFYYKIVLTNPVQKE